MVDLTGKVAIVTGGGRGIGRGIALGLAQAGAKVVINDFYRDEDGVSAADQVVKEIEELGSEGLANQQDISVWEAGENIVSAAVEKFGRVDVLVMCAGNLNISSLAEITEEEWDLSMNIHVKGQLTVTQAASNQMIKQGEGGRIVMFSSRAAFFGFSPAYPAAKAAVYGLSIATANELSKHNITCNCILPSAQTQLFPFDAKSRPTGGGTPRTDDIAPETVAPLITYLASEEGGHITGRAIYATGGDVCFYEQPMDLSNRPVFLRKQGRWTPDELGEVLPTLLGYDQ